MNLPIRTRLALVCAALVGGIVVVLGAVVYLRLEADLREATDDVLLGRAAALANLLPDEPVIEIGPTDIGDVFAQLLSPEGEVVASTPGLDAPILAAGLLPDDDADGVHEVVVRTEEESFVARLRAVPRDDGLTLVVGVGFDDQREAIDRLLVLLLVVAPVAAVLAGLVGWFVAAAALRPVDRMRRESEAISGSEPSLRLAVPATHDEISALGVSLNRMLDRLEAALVRERRFVDDASHELRTPLANLKVELDLALRRARTPEELVAALRSAAGETDRLTSLAEDLLVLARAAEGRVPVRREPTDLDALVRDVVDRFRARAEAQGVALQGTVEVDGAVRLDAARIRQALGNLIDNALRHTPAGGRILVSASRSGDVLTIGVADSGEGFPPAFLEDAFEAFSRADSARSRDDGGTGLGLAIVRAVAHGHGGSVAARNNPDGGATVELRIPL